MASASHWGEGNKIGLNEYSLFFFKESSQYTRSVDGRQRLYVLKCTPLNPYLLLLLYDATNPQLDFRNLAVSIRSTQGRRRQEVMGGEIMNFQH
jgi:hypothetical protein